MANLQPESLEVAGLHTGVVRSAPDGKVPLLLLHGGSPGISPFCSGLHVWDTVLPAFARERATMALDLPGSGATALPTGTAPTIEALGAHVLAVLERFGESRCHVVGHDEGGLLALWLATNATPRVASICIVASRTAAPGGDALPTIALVDPPLPWWSRLAQQWALEQLSYSAAHVSDEFLDACVAAAGGEAHRGVLESFERDANLRFAFAQSAGRTKTQLFRIYRERGVPVPVQLVWGSSDPLTGVDRGFGLFELVARKQAFAQFDVINRAGNLPFREEPRAFVDVVGAFHEAVDAG